MHFQGKDWQLVWSDEFNGPSFDRSKWAVEVNAFGGGNHELQIYTDSLRNVRIDDNRLILEAHRERTGIQGTFRDWSSGRVRTKYRGDWTYGYFEVRARLPKGRGFWPAIWMLPTNEECGVWPGSGEIDLMELKGHQPDRVSAAVHYGPPWPRNRFKASVPLLILPRDHPDFSEGFHTFGLLRGKRHLQWFVDREPVWKVSIADLVKDGAHPDAFTKRFHLILNLAVGGHFPGPPSRRTPSAARMEVDWVRVWQ